MGELRCHVILLSLLYASLIVSLDVHVFMPMCATYLCICVNVCACSMCVHMCVYAASVLVHPYCSFELLCVCVYWVS